MHMGKGLVIMSIVLEYKKYCENCPNFKPIKEVTEYEGFDSDVFGRFTVISCENKIVCDQMFSYLEDYFKEEEGLNGRNR